MTPHQGRIIELYPVRFHNDGLEHLLLRRSPEDSLYPSIWQIVTGSIEEGETASRAALREFKEETGLTPLRFWVLPHVGAFYDYRRANIEFSPQFCCQVPDGLAPVLSPEHTAWRWLPAGAAKPMLAWPSQQAGIDLVEWMIGRGERAEGLLDLTGSEL
ncbi:MAG: NUDIX domain-containing protein [Bacteroidota bacterium]